MDRARLRRRLTEARPRAAAPRRRPRPPAPAHVVVNPLEAPESDRYREPLFLMWAGGHGFSEHAFTRGYVWARSVDDAFEQWVEWLDEHAPGALVTVDEAKLRETAAELGVRWREHWPDWDDPKFERVASSAEEGLTTIGHTTLEHGTHIESGHWGVDEVTDLSEYDRVLAYCRWRQSRLEDV